MYEEKIIENLRKYAHIYAYDNQELSETCLRAYNSIERLLYKYKMSLNKIEELQKPQWIFVKERLPDKNEGLVLVCMPDEFPYNTKQPYPDVEHNERICIAHYENCVKHWWMDGYKHGTTIPIAWMPLPEPPKEETDGN